jgi:hypothetical protein
MFERKKTSPNPTAPYAFGPTHPAAANSSDAVRQKEQETIYRPLPAHAPSNARHGIEHSSTALPPRNPFADGYKAQSTSRPDSPSLSHPLLSHANNTDSNPSSPVTHHASARDPHSTMIPPSRNYGRDGPAGMPPRGESRNALLPDRQVRPAIVAPLHLSIDFNAGE